MNLTPHPNKSIIHPDTVISGRYDFTACQLDILGMLLVLIKENDEPNKPYLISVKSIEVITGRKWEHDELTEATAVMGSRMFTVKTAQFHDQIWLFQGVRYPKGEDFFAITISEVMRPYLFNLKNNFTVIPLVKGGKQKALKTVNENNLNNNLDNK